MRKYILDITDSSIKRQLSFIPLFLISLSITMMIVFFPYNSPAFKKRNIKFVQELTQFSEEISFRSPTDVWVGMGGDIYILDSSLRTIFIFTKYFSPVSTIDKTNGLHYPLCGVTDEKGMVYISEEVPEKGKNRSQITIFDRIGRKKRVVHFSGFPKAQGFMARDMAIDEKGVLYLAGGLSNPLIIISQEGEYLKTIQPEEVSQQDGSRIKTDVSGISIIGDTLYLLSERFGKVYAYKKDGKYVNSFGKKGSGRGELSRPQGLAIDYDHGIYYYVMDYLRHTLIMYDSSGNFLDEFGGLGTAKGWFSYPRGICIDDLGRLFISDTFNKRVQIFQTRL